MVQITYAPTEFAVALIGDKEFYIGIEPETDRFHLYPLSKKEQEKVTILFRHMSSVLLIDRKR